MDMMITKFLRLRPKFYNGLICIMKTKNKSVLLDISFEHVNAVLRNDDSVERTTFETNKYDRDTWLLRCGPVIFWLNQNWYNTLLQLLD